MTQETRAERNSTQTTNANAHRHWNGKESVTIPCHDDKRHFIKSLSVHGRGCSTREFLQRSAGQLGEVECPRGFQNESSSLEQSPWRSQEGRKNPPHIQSSSIAKTLPSPSNCAPTRADPNEAQSAWAPRSLAPPGRRVAMRTLGGPAHPRSWHDDDPARAWH